MPFAKALLVAVPIATSGGWLAYDAHSRVLGDQRALHQLDQEERSESEMFLRTLQGAHAERQLEILTQRRHTALSLAAARRDRLLGLALAALGALAFAFIRTAQRIRRELAEASPLLATPTLHATPAVTVAKRDEIVP